MESYIKQKTMARKLSDYIKIGMKGCAMGAADVVPGVSGGTIAFISGIYEELIDSIKSIDLTAIKLLLQFRFKEFWTKVNGNFLLSIVLGVGTAIFSLSRVMTYLLENHPIYIWSFFFGLIIASTILVFKEIKKVNIYSIIAMIIGAAIAYTITVISPASTPETWWFIILSGAIAICAMILPGISGAFLLLLMGKYQFIMGAIGSLDIYIISLFALGASVGIISFSHLLSWLLKHFHTVTISLLTGFMVGSLNKVWPWKETMETFVDRHGVTKPLIESNVSPFSFTEITGDENHLVASIAMCIIGILSIYTLEMVGNRFKSVK